VLQDHENRRDYRRFESLIKSLAVLVGGFLGADVSGILDEARSEHEAEEIEEV
jgi:hypothetical protein